MKTSTIVVVLVVLGAIVAGWYWLGLPPMPPRSGSPGGVACTADAMQCPDGSWVGRTGPNCEFVCPTPAAPAQPALIQGSASSSVTTGTAAEDPGLGDASVPAQ